MGIAFSAFFLLVFVYKADFKGFRGFNENYLSTGTATSIKGLGALIIVSQHVLASQKFYEIAGYYDVALAFFFFFSGFGLMYGFLNKKDYVKNLLRKRIPALLIPFITAAVFYLPFKIYIKSIPKSVLNVLIGKSLFVSFSWYVYAILIFYIALYVIFRISKNKPKVIFALSALLLIGYPAALYLLHYDKFWYFTYVSFFLGLLWCYKKDSIDSFIQKHYFVCWAMVIPIFAVSYAVLPVVHKVLGFYPETIAYNLRSMALMVSVILVLTKVNIGNKLTSFLGKISYEIYLMHGACLIIFKEILNIENLYLKYLLVLVSSIIVSWIFYYINTFLKNLIVKRSV